MPRIPFRTPLYPVHYLINMKKKSIKDPNFNDAGSAVSSPAASSKSCLEDLESELLLASVFPAPEVQATTTPGNLDGTL
ncbi:hypothetical protein I3760_05G204100 [Carya illinoinensis]|nr:hypothetical protein I3760_05G204100 [Carya illinoinensis]